MIAVLDYGIGNLRSAEKALQRVGADASLTADPAVAAAADGLVLPGVGAFGRCLEALRASGLDTVVHDAVESGRPFLAICVGMQMLYEGSAESPGSVGLGVLPGVIRRLPDGVKRPQMQWNRLEVRPGSGVWLGDSDPARTGAREGPWVYFVHSFAAPAGPHVVATCDYGGPVTAAVELGRIWATQFHPEKSGAAGLRILAAFAAASSAAAAAPAGSPAAGGPPAPAAGGPPAPAPGGPPAPAGGPPAPGEPFGAIGPSALRPADGS